MRIAIVGDLQYEKDESLDTVAAEIAALHPDHTILVGDYGYWDIFGSYEAFHRVAAAFERAGIPRPLALVGGGAADEKRHGGGELRPCLRQPAPEYRAGV